MSDNWTAYYTVTCNEDGEVRVNERTHDEVIAILNIDEETGELLDRPFIAGETWDSDPNYWKGNRVLIIKGEIVTPQPVSIRYELP